MKKELTNVGGLLLGASLPFATLGLVHKHNVLTIGSLVVAVIGLLMIIAGALLRVMHKTDEADGFGPIYVELLDVFGGPYVLMLCATICWLNGVADTSDVWWAVGLAVLGIIALGRRKLTRHSK